MISPLATLHPWLLNTVMFDTPMCDRPNGRRRLVAVQRKRSNGPLQYKFAEYRAAWSSETPELDLRHFSTRAVVLQVLNTYGYCYPWALGGIWSDLSDEQAGRAVAEILRRIGSEPKRPVEALPFGVLSEWMEPEEGDKPPKSIYRGKALAWREVVIGNDDGGRYACVFEHSWLADFRPPEGVKVEGSETGLAGRIAADRAARDSGAIFWEEITP